MYKFSFMATIFSFSLFAMDYTPKNVWNVCEEIATDIYSRDVARDCLNLAKEGTFNNGYALNTCYQLARKSLSHRAYSCLLKVEGNDFDGNVSDVCTANIDNDYGRTTLKCLEKTANKTFQYESIKTCVQLAYSGRAFGSLDCLDQIAL